MVASETRNIQQPILFGLVYSESVATLPKAVFMLAASILVIGVLLMLLVKNPGKVPVVGQKGKTKGRSRRYLEVERGRSRVSKDLRGGAIPDYSML